MRLLREERRQSRTLKDHRDNVITHPHCHQGPGVSRLGHRQRRETHARLDRPISAAHKHQPETTTHHAPPRPHATPIPDRTPTPPLILRSRPHYTRALQPHRRPPSPGTGHKRRLPRAPDAATTGEQPATSRRNRHDSGHGSIFAWIIQGIALPPRPVLRVS